MRVRVPWHHVVHIEGTSKFTVRSIIPGAAMDAPKDYDTEAECEAWIDGWTVRNEEAYEDDTERLLNDRG